MPRRRASGWHRLQLAVGEPLDVHVKTDVVGMFGAELGDLALSRRCQPSGHSHHARAAETLAQNLER